MGWGGVVALMIIVSPPVQTRSQELGVMSFELVWTSSGLSLDNNGLETTMLNIL